jgi:hypothetical protein
MGRVLVQSSLIAAICYDEALRTLDVELVNGKAYRYFDVPEIAVARLRKGPSVGRVFNETIRDSYQYTEITRDRSK